MGSIVRLSVLLVAACATYRGCKTELPGEAAPQFATVTNVDKEKGVLSYRFSTKRVGFVEQICDENGKQVKKATLVHISEQNEESALMKDVHYYNAKGMRLSPSVAWRRLSAGTVVLLSTDGKKVHPQYLRAVQKNTLILVVPFD
jgi:hypothetical protein